MQISANTLLASQLATPVPPRPAPGFAAALEKTGDFAPLPLKQVAAAPENPGAAGPFPASLARPGARIDITV